jgi:putative ABC transport system ATP-binding protein
MIELRNVTRTYIAGEVRVEALRGVDLEIAPGEFSAIAGPSGSGKTTLMNIIGTIDRHDEGRVTIDGVDTGTMDKRARAAYRREHLGFVFQSYNLIPVLSAYENVAFALSLLGTPEKETRQRVMGLLDEVGLAGMENRVPSKLSGGQQQRVAIARALVKQPRIILADEPTANLDSHTGEEILKLMQEMNRRHNTTFVFCTHDPMVMDYAKRLIRLHDGLVESDERREASV